MRAWTRGAWVNSSEHTNALARDFPLLSTSPSSFDPFVCTVDSQPGAPPLLSYNRTRFCEVLRGRDILLIGDSIDGQFYHIVQWYGREEKGWNEWDGRGDPRLKGRLCQRSGSRPLSVGHFFSPQLDVPPTRTRGSMFITEFIGEAQAQGFSPGLVVMNKGAHYAPNARLLQLISAAIDAVSRALPNATIVWRNSMIGHADCDNIMKPLSTPQPLEGLPYNWDLIHRQNALVEEHLRTHFPHVVYLDVASPTRFRGDMHPHTGKDCLHFDMKRHFLNAQFHWIRLLYNALLLEREIA